MKKIQSCLLALVLVVTSTVAWAQTSNPATTKPNQTKLASSPVVGDNEIKNSTNSERTDSVITPQQGTSISTAPGTPDKKSDKPRTKNKKKTKTPY